MFDSAEQGGLTGLSSQWRGGHLAWRRTLNRRTERAQGLVTRELETGPLETGLLDTCYLRVETYHLGAWESAGGGRWTFRGCEVGSDEVLEDSVRESMPIEGSSR